MKNEPREMKEMSPTAMKPIVERKGCISRILGRRMKAIGELKEVEGLVLPGLLLVEYE